MHKKTFCYRYSIEEMQKTLSELATYPTDYKKWCRTVNSLVKNKKIINFKPLNFA
jgi:hypothetical protein